MLVFPGKRSGICFQAPTDPLTSCVHLYNAPCCTHTRQHHFPAVCACMRTLLPPYLQLACHQKKAAPGARSHCHCSVWFGPSGWRRSPDPARLHPVDHIRQNLHAACNSTASPTITSCQQRTHAHTSHPNKHQRFPYCCRVARAAGPGYLCSLGQERARLARQQRDCLTVLLSALRIPAAVRESTSLGQLAPASQQPTVGLVGVACRRSSVWGKG